MTRSAMLIRWGGGGSPAISLSDADLLSISLRARAAVCALLPSLQKSSEGERLARLW